MEFSKRETNRKHIQIIASVAANLGQASRAFCISMSSYVVPQVIKGEGGLLLTESEASWFASIFAFGCITGALHGGFWADKIGRRSSMIVDAIGYITGFLTIGLSQNFTMLMIGRLLTGHFSGSSLISAPSFVGETSHPSLRGITGTMLTVLYCCGFTASMSLGAILSWKSVVLTAASIPAISLILLIFMKESPSWLLRNNRNDECLESLMFYRGNEFLVQEEYQRIELNLRRQEKENDMLGDTFCEKLQSKLRRLLSGCFLKPFFLLVTMTSLGLEWGGFPALSYYLHTVIEEVGIPLDPYLVAILLSAYRTVMCIFLTPLIGKAPRRTMYLSSGVVVASALFLQSSYAWFSNHQYVPSHIQVYTRWIPLIAILLQYTGFSLGWGVIVMNLLGEILPSDMRATGAALLGIIQNMFLFSAVKMIPVIISSAGPSVLFGIYGTCIMVVVITCAFFMPETKGLSLEDIEDFYSPRKQQENSQQNNFKESII